MKLKDKIYVDDERTVKPYLRGTAVFSSIYSLSKNKLLFFLQELGIVDYDDDSVLSVIPGTELYTMQLRESQRYLVVNAGAEFIHYEKIQQKIYELTTQPKSFL